MSCLVTSIFSLGKCAVLHCNPEGKQMVNLMVISVFKKYIFLKIHMFYISANIHQFSVMGSAPGWDNREG